MQHDQRCVSSLIRSCGYSSTGRSELDGSEPGIGVVRIGSAVSTGSRINTDADHFSESPSRPQDATWSEDRGSSDAASIAKSFYMNIQVSKRRSTVHRGYQSHLPDTRPVIAPDVNVPQGMLPTPVVTFRQLADGDSDVVSKRTSGVTDLFTYRCRISALFFGGEVVVGRRRLAKHSVLTHAQHDCCIRATTGWM